MNTRSTTTSAQVLQEKEEKVLRLKKPAEDTNNSKSKSPKGRHIHWSPETVDNEHLNRKKSNSKTGTKTIHC